MDPSDRSPDPRVQMAAWYLCGEERCFWGLYLLLGLPVFIAVLFLRSLAEDPQENLKASRAALLALAPPSLPKAENAAEDYRAAFGLLVPYPDDYQIYCYLQERDNKFSELPAIQAWLSANAPAIQSLYRAVQKPRCNWGLDYTPGFEMCTSHGGPALDPSELLAIYARARAHAGDHNAAAKAISAIYALQRHLETDRFATFILTCMPMSLSYGSDYSVEAIEALVLYDTPAQPADTARYRAALDLNWNPHEHFARFLEMEGACAVHLLDQEALLGVDRSLLVSDLGSNPTLVTEALIRLAYGSERRCMVEATAALVEKVRNGEWLDLNAIYGVAQAHQYGPATLALEFLPALESYYRNCLWHLDEVHLTDAGLACLQYRQTYGRDPKSLEELVPEFFPAVPVSALNGLPMRVRVNLKGLSADDPVTRKSVQVFGSVLEVYWPDRDSRFEVFRLPPLEPREPPAQKGARP